MPSGKVHDRITIVAAAIAAPVWWFVAPIGAQAGETLALAGSILVSGLLFSPDLDLDSSIYRRWGPLRFIWWPYQKLLPHRSDFSHGFLLGPIVRLLYFALVCWLFLRIGTWIAVQFVPFDRNGFSQQTSDLFVRWYHSYPRHLALFLAGTFIGAGLHTGADLLVTGWKRRTHRRRRHH